MRVAKLTLTLLEPVSFATRQANKTTITEPIIHPYALAFALGWAGREGAKPNPYITGVLDGSSTRGPDHRGMLAGMPFRLTAATSTGHSTVTRTLQRGEEGLRSAPKDKNSKSPESDLFGKNVKNGADLKDTNIPVYVFSRELDTGSQFVAYAYGEIPEFPPYIRLGRWMSKCRVDVQLLDAQRHNGTWHSRATFLPEDAPEGTEDFSILGMNPCPLIQEPSGQGHYLQAQGVTLPIH